jgi:peptidoglycan/LPS O-acetylase OafA/YrhL
VFCYVYAIIAVNTQGALRAYYNSPTVGIGLPIGCALGVLVIRAPDWAVTRFFRHTSAAIGACFGIAVIAIFLSGQHVALDYGLRVVFDVFVAILVGHIFVRATEPSWLMRGLSFRPFVGLGIISYAVYLFHLPLIYSMAVLATATPPLQQMIFEGIVLVAAGTASYYVLEKPIRRYGLRGAIQNLFSPPRPVSKSTRPVVPEQAETGE